MFGLQLLVSSANHGIDIYTNDANQRTIERLLELTRGILKSGFGVIVDATLIHTDWRDALSSLAEELKLSWKIVFCDIDNETARKRLAARKGDASEATYEQFTNQQKSFDAFTETESAHLITVNNENPESLQETITKLRDLFVTTT